MRKTRFMEDECVAEEAADVLARDITKKLPVRAPRRGALLQIIAAKEHASATAI